MTSECRECFAHTYNVYGVRCTILSEPFAYNDKPCPFFKTPKQDKQSRMKARDRLRYLGIKEEPKA